MTPISTKLSHRQSFALSRARPSRTGDSQKRFTFLCQNQSITLGLLCKQRTSPKHSTTDLTDADPLHVTGPPHFRSATQHKEYDAPPRRKVNITHSMTGFQPFPVNNFKYFLTLFSKFFSSFPHGTCSLSVSRRYLALDELYHPFSAALPSNTTLRTHIVRGELQVEDGILTLYDTLFQRIYTWVDTDRTSLGYNSTSG